ncbi:glycopeptide antibiotics resistance protein [Amycolatopsis bartoniae]|uniref:VanZ family protein n=1 Tax=Amycolatopsis bartoniae TaxID=941986 RepID=A0A8H9MBM1_9PSEU|nr:VanZ family protein [Amycolatopsis bartoniae]MBB2933111.1 glycopeptide antibiotics resistance protein [Amycolatopsis bartoniae]TVT11887.1 VanZ family protein [Amycolatopsis bartoniae]GHF57150.1 VanZ family protein [Amycolatopsis bartoniae]
MTSVQVNALGTGLLVFLALWAAVLVPQVITHHARFGRVIGRRVAATGALLCYACLALAVVFLPLPGPRAHHLAQDVQLVPFQWIADVHRDAAGNGLVDALTTTAFEQMALNVVLFVPLGIFARMLWRRGFAGTVLLGFACSLLVEITQLTANWGTAPFQYRIFDVDDLITNTTGAAVGWVGAALYLLLRASAVRAEALGSERVDLAETR